MQIEYLAGEYDGALVALSYVVACFAAYAAIDLTQRIFDSGARQWLWLGLGAFAMGTGIWSMHFIGMQAFSLPIALGYDLGQTLISLVTAIAVALLALYMASRSNLGGGAIVIGAVLMGLGISGMHYTGMAAMRMQPGIEYHLGLFAASVVIAVAASAAALWLLHHLRRIDARWRLPARLAAAAIMGVAVVGMHYTGMAAANFPIGSLCGAAGDLTGGWTTGPVTAFTFVLTALILWLAALDTAQQARARAARRLLEEEQRARFLAFHDGLTKLPNRTQFKQEVPGFISRSTRMGRPFDLFYCVFQVPGLQDAQTIDRVALTLAERLRSTARPGDLLARHDRMEFVLLRDRHLTAEPPARVRNYLLELCRAAIQLENGSWVVPQIHVGTAEYPRDGSNSRNLLLTASRAPVAAAPVPAAQPSVDTIAPHVEAQTRAA